MIDFQLLKQTAQLRAEDLLREWYPAGKVRGHEFVVGNSNGDPGDSMSINLSKCVGADFSTGQKFGDLLDVYCARFGVDITQGAQELADKLGIKIKIPKGSKPVTGIRNQEPKKTEEPKSWRDACFRAGTQFIPVDHEIDPNEFATRERGVPDHTHVYRDEEGDPLFVVARWNENEQENLKKSFCPFTWHDGSWSKKGFPTPRPLYGLEQLKKTKNVLVVEGEKTADIARTMFPDNPVVTWPNGAASVKSADWLALKGRKVIVWPDNDNPGRTALSEIANILVPIIDGELRYVDTSTMPHGFDAGDMAGTTPADALAWIKSRIKVWEVPKIVEPYVDEPEPATPGVEQNNQDLWNSLGLECKTNGVPHPSVDNAVRILNHRIPDGHLHYDSFLNQVRFWDNGSFSKLQDHHLITLTIAIQRDYRIQDMQKSTVRDAVAFLARTKVRNCLREWLEGLVWDGTNRVQSLFSSGFGAPDNDYTKAVSKNFVVGLIARAMKPGCQVDTLPILEGRQGIGKSRGLEALAGEFYADIDSAIGTREFAEQIQGKWLVELSELSAMRPSEVERVKSGITRTVDVYREPFAVLANDHPRQCVFAGTTNQTNYLLDNTGNRRFWPIKCGHIDKGWIKENREQMFAEALTIYASGGDWWSVPEEQTNKEQEERVIVDGINEKVRDYVDLRPTNVRISEILELWDIPKHQWSRLLQQRIAEALRSMGYFSVKSNGLQVWRRQPGQAEVTKVTKFRSL